MFSEWMFLCPCHRGKESCCLSLKLENLLKSCMRRQKLLEHVKKEECPEEMPLMAWPAGHKAAEGDGLKRALWILSRVTIPQSDPELEQ